MTVMIRQVWFPPAWGRGPPGRPSGCRGTTDLVGRVITATLVRGASKPVGQHVVVRENLDGVGIAVFGDQFPAPVGWRAAGNRGRLVAFDHEQVGQDVRVIHGAGVDEDFTAPARLVHDARQDQQVSAVVGLKALDDRIRQVESLLNLPLLGGSHLDTSLGRRAKGNVFDLGKVALVLQVIHGVRVARHLQRDLVPAEKFGQLLRVFQKHAGPPRCRGQAQDGRRFPRVAVSRFSRCW